MLLTDLRETKTVLEIDPSNTSEDKKLNFCIEYASQWIEEAINRPGLSYKQRTEFYGGTGTQKLLLRSRPVYSVPTIQVFVDEGGYFGSVTGSFDPTSSAWTYGTDFCLQIDQDDGLRSRSGILVCMNNLWPRPSVRQAGWLSPFIGDSFGTIKVVYTAGYLVDDLPPVFRFACNFLVAKMRQALPYGFLLTSESYEDRSVSYFIPHKNIWLGEIMGMLSPYINRKWF